jgi:hypothetical protein
MTDYDLSTESRVTRAQEKVIGRFCSRCRRHRSVEGGATLPAGSGRTRWVCGACLTIIKEHRKIHGNVPDR